MIWDWIFSYRGPLIDDIIYIYRIYIYTNEILRGIGSSSITVPIPIFDSTQPAAFQGAGRINSILEQQRTRPRIVRRSKEMGRFSNTNGELDLGCFTSSNIICGYLWNDKSGSCNKNWLYIRCRCWTYWWHGYGSNIQILYNCTWSWSWAFNNNKLVEDMSSGMTDIYIYVCMYTYRIIQTHVHRLEQYARRTPNVGTKSWW